MTAKATMTKTAKILSFRRSTGTEEEVRVGLPPIGAAESARKTVKALDLSGKPTAWFLIGLNYSGKTTWARWAGWRADEGQRELILAALDPTNRTLADFFDGVAQPTSSEASQTARWLRELVGYIMENRAAAVMDMGGGDTSLGKLISTAPGIVQAIDDAGVAPVAAYFLGPRVDDLATLATFEAQGFSPKATVLILNEARVDGAVDPEEAFASLKQHSAFKAAVDRGAVVIHMPRLEPQDLALEIERKRLQFGQARDGIVPDGRNVSPIGGLDRSSVRHWLEQMNAAFEPVKSWLP